MHWQLEEAQDHLDELLDAAEKTGPQFISSQEGESVVVLSMQEYRRLTGHTGSLPDSG